MPCTSNPPPRSPGSAALSAFGDTVAHGSSPAAGVAPPASVGSSFDGLFEHAAASTPAHTPHEGRSMAPFLARQPEPLPAPSVGVGVGVGPGGGGGGGAAEPFPPSPPPS